MGVDDRDEVSSFQDISSKVETSRSCLGCIPLPLHLCPYVVSDLEFAAAINGLPSQATVAGKITSLRFDDPKSVAVFDIIALVPVNLRPGFIAVLCPWVELHHVGVGQKSLVIVPSY